MSAVEWLDEIEARAAAAGPAPWTFFAETLEIADANGGILEMTWPGHQIDNATFIAHARQDVPTLVAALRAVLDMTRHDLDESPDYEERLWEQGFNTALDDARTAITAALDGTR